MKKDIDDLTEASQVDKWPVTITEAQHIVQKVEQFHTDIERSEETIKTIKV
ncbi:hypothetical protein [Piscibacillus salipiscarius]|uniref:hypothetical protein n=1 Tax=Piscibacillus salipiscarius TaxID=299480 RepID=UPI0024369EA8|nr:hypothetical protein [Piscibacillus salipiscarius]